MNACFYFTAVTRAYLNKVTERVFRLAHALCPADEERITCKHLAATTTASHMWRESLHCETSALGDARRIH